MTEQLIQSNPKDREYILCIKKDRERFYLKSYRYLKQKAFSFPEQEILYMGYKDGEDMEDIKVIVVRSVRTNEMIRSRQEALDEVLRMSLSQMATNEK